MRSPSKIPLRACGRIGGHLQFVDVACRQLELGDDARPTQARVEAQAIEGLAGEVVVAVGRLFRQAPTARGAGKLADRQGEALDEHEGRLMGDVGGRLLPELFVDPAEIGRLAESGAMHVPQGRKEVWSYPGWGHSKRDDVPWPRRL